jgi:Spy/CpxP family protein refolding chaperone
MKKFLVAAALVGVISLAGVSMVNARGNYGNSPGIGHGDCGGYGYCNNWSYDEQDKEKAAAFLAETKETRKQIAVKRGERKALMRQDNPDEKRVAALTGEIFDLKNLLDEKAKETFGDSPRLGHMRGRGGFGRCGGEPRNF